MPSGYPLIDGRTYKRLCRARDFAAANFDQPITVASLASEASFSPWHFHRLFTATFGQTPHAFLSDLRLRRAKQLLASENLSVTDICFETGFSSVGTFSSWFRSSSGLPPSLYRREVRRVFGIATPWRSIFVPTCFLAAFSSLE